jgi:HEAT repeat protein
MPGLGRMLASATALERQRATAVLGLIAGTLGAGESAGVRRLVVGRVSDADEFVRREAVEQLGGGALINEESAAAIVGALRDAAPHVREAAVEQLAAHWRTLDAMEAIARSVMDAEFPTGVPGVEGVASFGAPGEAWLVRFLDARGAEVRCAAASHIGVGVIQPREAVGPLARMAVDRDEGPASAALEALARLGPTAAGAVPAVVRAYSAHAAEGVRLRAVVAAYLIGGGSEPVRDLLIAAAEDADAYVRGAALQGMERLGLRDEGARAAVRRMLGDRVDWIRGEARRVQRVMEAPAERR